MSNKIQMTQLANLMKSVDNKFKTNITQAINQAVKPLVSSRNNKTNKYKYKCHS
jgi:hypothetical protein